MDEQTQKILLMDWVMAPSEAVPSAPAPEAPTAVPPAPAPAPAPRRPLREREQTAQAWQSQWQPEFFAVPGTKTAPDDLATSARMAALLGFYSSQPFAPPRSLGDGVRAIARLGRAWLIRYRPLLEKDPAIPVLEFDWYSPQVLDVFDGDVSAVGRILAQVRLAYGRLIGYQSGRTPEIGVGARTVGQLNEMMGEATHRLNLTWSALAYRGFITPDECAFITHHTNCVVTMPHVYQNPNVGQYR